jgi:hypothetical protein
LNLFIQQEIVARYAVLSYSTCNGGRLRSQRMRKVRLT